MVVSKPPHLSTEYLRKDVSLNPTARLRLCVEQIANEKGITLTELHQRTGLTMAMLSRYWHNQLENVSLRALDSIAMALDVEPANLIVRDSNVDKKGEAKQMEIRYKAVSSGITSPVKVVAINGIGTPRNNQPELFGFVQSYATQGWQVTSDKKVADKWLITMILPDSDSSPGWEHTWLHWQGNPPMVTHRDRKPLDISRDLFTYVEELRQEGWMMVWQDRAYRRNFMILKRKINPSDT